MGWKGIVTTSAAVMAAILLLVAMRPLSEWIVGQFIDQPKKDKSPVGRIADFSGRVETRDEDSPWVEASRDSEIFHGQRIRVQNGGELSLKVQSQHTVSFQGPSEIIVERWSTTQKESPYLISMVRGEFTLSAPGRPGQLFILQDKRVFPIEAKPIPQGSRVVEIVKEPEIPALEITTALTDEEPQPTPKPAPRETKANIGAKLPDKIPEAETLSNKYIESVLAGMSEDFRRCQMNSLRDKRESKGQLLLSLTIQPAGTVNNVYVLQDSNLDHQLVDCTVSVVSRAKFKNFEGLPISLSYPIEYR